MTDLAVIEARYSKALDAKPGKGEITAAGIAAITDSVCDIPELVERVKAAEAERDARADISPQRLAELNDWARFQSDARDGWENRARKAEAAVARARAELSDHATLAPASRCDCSEHRILRALDGEP